MTPSESPQRMPVGAAELERLRGLVHALVGDAHTTDDVLQETWLAARRMPAEVRAEPQVMAWLRTTARRLAGQRLREEGRRGNRERDAARAEAVEDDSLERLEAYRRLLGALADLPEPYRTTLRLRFLDGQSPRAIAARLDRTPDLVRKHLQRGLERLRGSLDARHGGGRRGRQAWMVALVPLRPSPAVAAGGSLVSVFLGVLAMKLWIVPPCAALGALFLLHGAGEAPGPAELGPDRPEVAGRVPAEIASGRRALAERSAQPAGEPSPPAAREVVAPAEAGVAVTRLRFVAAGTERPLPSAELEMVQVRTPFDFEGARTATGLLRPGGDGELELEWPEGLEEFEFVVEAPGFGRTRVEVPAFHFDSVDVLEVELFPLTTISGQVVDPAGHPVQGALVFAAGDEAWLKQQFLLSSTSDESGNFSISTERRTFGWSRTPRSRSEAHGEEVATDASGRFRLDVPLAPLPIGPEFASSAGTYLVVRHPEFAFFEAQASDEGLALALGAGTAVLQLEAAAARPVRVVDAYDVGVPGALVLTASENSDLHDLDWLSLARGGETGADGRFMWPASPIAPEVLWVFAEGYADRRIELDVPDPEVELTLRTERGTDLVVQVFDEQGMPVPGVLVEVKPFRELSRTELEAITDADGIVAFPRLAAGPVELGVKTRGGFMSEPSLELELPVGPVTVVLERPVVFTGELMGEHGPGELLFELEFEDRGERHRQAVEGVVVDPETGRYRLPTPDPRVDRVRLHVTDGQGRAFEGPWFAVEAGLVELDVQLKTPEGVEGPKDSSP